MPKQISCFLLVLYLFGLSSCQTALTKPEKQQTDLHEEVDLRITPSTQSEPLPLTYLPSSTPTPQPILMTAIVFQEIPEAPILMYHRFNPISGSSSSKYNVSLADFDAQLQALYDAGYSLVALDDWLRNEIELPSGRRPLIITIDDLFYADQISLDEKGQPAPYSGIGRLWQFYQAHPTFNFHLALFYNLGDKGYANRYANGNFFVESGWKEDRAKAIAWCIQNGAIPYNHFYDHPNLSQLSPDDILWQLQVNDAALREALALVGQNKLAEDLPNILALPYVIWPENEAGKQVLYNYQSPESTPVLAILEANDGNLVRPLPAPFAESFDPYHVKRLTATWDAVNAIVNKANDIPLALTCDLGEMPFDSQLDSNQVSEVILDKIEDGTCPYGYYAVGKLAFFARENSIVQLSP